jgi:hypothetical protein
LPVLALRCQGLEGDVGAEIEARLCGKSTEELEHLFLEFHAELQLVRAALPPSHMACWSCQ